MSEEEIINKIEKIIKHFESREYILNDVEVYKHIQGLLDLYNKKKEEVESLRSSLRVVIQQRDDNQKEIEELKEKNIKLANTIKSLNEEKVRKDEIREKIKEIDKILNENEDIKITNIELAICTHQKNILEELLEE